MSKFYQKNLKERKTQNPKSSSKRVVVTSEEVIHSMQMKKDRIEELRKLNENIYNSIPEESRNKQERLFNKIDDDRTGELSFEEVAEQLKKKEPSFKEHTILGILQSMDQNGDSSIDQMEFCIFMNRLEKPIDFITVKNQFKIMDKDGKGYVNKETLFKFQHMIGFKFVTFKDITNLMSNLKCSDKGIDFKRFQDSFEFKDMFKFRFDTQDMQTEGDGEGPGGEDGAGVDLVRGEGNDGEMERIILGNDEE